jgi:hypothetical protein
VQSRTLHTSAADGDRLSRKAIASPPIAGRLALSIWLVGDVRREVKAPRPAAS